MKLNRALLKMMIVFGPSFLLADYSAAQTSSEGEQICTGNGDGSAKLLFKSSFESPVTLTHHNSSKRSSSELHGADQGYNWDDLPGQEFRYVTPNAQKDGLVITRLDTSKAKSGSRSLYMSKEKSAAGSQNRLQWDAFNGAASDPSLNKVFIRKWVWLPKLQNFLKKPYSNTSVGGIRHHSSYSVPLRIRVGSEGGEPRWNMDGINYAATEKYWQMIHESNDGWRFVDTTHTIPQERWFLLEQYFERDIENGVAQMWVDGELIVDMRGVRTMNPRGADTGWAKIADIDGTPLYLYVDDVEIWNGIPEGEVICSSSDLNNGDATGAPVKPSRLSVESIAEQR